MKMKNLFYYPGLFISLLVIALPSSAGEESSEEMITIEGVAGRRRTAPIAALREIDGRFRGLPFSVVDGKYVNFEDQAPAASLDTSDKRVTGVSQLRTGLYRAMVEVTAPAGTIGEMAQLGEELVEGRGEIGKDGNIFAARRRARNRASEKAVLSIVRRLYPGGSAPTILTGRLFFLGAVREWIEGGEYVLLARIKVRLSEP